MVCEPFHQGVIGPLPLPDAVWISRPESEKNTDDTDFKRRWGMGGTKPIESGVEVMPRRSAVGSMLSGAIDTDSFDTNQMKGDIGQKNIDKKATTLLTTTGHTMGKPVALLFKFIVDQLVGFTVRAKRLDA